MASSYEHGTEISAFIKDRTRSTTVILLDVKPCSYDDRYRRFGSICLHFQARRDIEEGSSNSFETLLLKVYGVTSQKAVIMLVVAVAAAEAVVVLVVA
jgi:hypothetical protein